MTKFATVSSGLLLLLVLTGCTAGGVFDSPMAKDDVAASEAPTRTAPQQPDATAPDTEQGNGFESPLESTVDERTPPSFVQTPQTAADLLPGDLASDFDLDPANIRFQGEWDDIQYYLAVRGTSAVQVVMKTPGGWGSTGSEGNSVLANADQNGRLRWQYLPQGTASVPEGWTALSGSMIVR